MYKTKIGFGLEIAGEGESIGEIRKETGERISSLKFWTDNTLSLIQIGRGYWKYTPNKEYIHFETQYDYDTRFGRRECNRLLYISAVIRLGDCLEF